MQGIKLIIFLLTFWLVITSIQANNTSTLSDREIASRATANDDQSKIIIKHSIIFHIMKNVKAIESDIFVTRKIDLAPIIKGIAEISDAGERVNVLCKDIPNVVQRAAQRAKDRKRG